MQERRQPKRAAVSLRFGSRRLQIYLHEVAHLVLNHVNKKPRHLEELEAEQWSFRVMRAEGIPVPRKSVQRQELCAV